MNNLIDILNETLKSLAASQISIAKANATLAKSNAILASTQLEIIGLLKQQYEAKRPARKKVYISNSVRSIKLSPLN
ncbi:MAG TPA: hypothetical protein VD794_08645 [Flavisolibacter sp.]|nr:hypothetical protein [Flavisolibacter sp.]